VQEFFSFSDPAVAIDKQNKSFEPESLSAKEIQTGLETKD
jgi:hypothetical protein